MGNPPPHPPCLPPSYSPYPHSTSPLSLWDESDASSARRLKSQRDRHHAIAEAKEHGVIPEVKGDGDEDVASAPHGQH